MQSFADPAGGALLYYAKSGVPTLSRVSATGAVSAPESVPAVTGIGDAGIPGTVAFMASGAAVVSWGLGSSGQYGEYFAYRAANGAWGKPVSAGQMSSFAVQPGTILTAQDDSTGLSAQSFPLSSTGTIGTPGTAQHIYTGGLLFNQSWMVLDPSGSAELVVDNSNVQTIARSAKGVWGSTTLLSASSNIQSVGVSSAPSGRAIVGWVQVTGNDAASTVYAAIRGPGADFSAPVSTGEDNVVGDGNLAIAKVAAGPDGTLAVGTTLEMQAPDASYTDTNSVRIAGPTQTTLGASHAIKPTLDIKAFTISSLGAGDSRAVVGTVQQNYGPPADDESYQENQVTSASVVASSGITAHTFGTSSGTYDENQGEGCKCAAQPPALSVAGVSLDAHGVGTAIGILNPGGPISYSVLGATAAPAKPRVALTSTKVKATATHAPVALSCTAAACRGTVTLTIGKKKEGSASYSVKAGKKATVQTKLTKAGKKAFKHAKAHHVKATVKITVKGGTTITKKVTVT